MVASTVRGCSEGFHFMWGDGDLDIDHEAFYKSYKQRLRNESGVHI